MKEFFLPFVPNIVCGFHVSVKVCPLCRRCPKAQESKKNQGLNRLFTHIFTTLFTNRFPPCILQQNFSTGNGPGIFGLSLRFDQPSTSMIIQRQECSSTTHKLLYISISRYFIINYKELQVNCFHTSRWGACIVKETLLCKKVLHNSKFGLKP